jgi:hypothetical protein
MLDAIFCLRTIGERDRDRGRKREKAVLELGRTLQKEPILLMGN